MSEDCLFCKIAAKEIDAKVIHEDENYFAFYDVNPQAPVHALIIPRKHIRTLNDIEPEDEPLVGGMFTLAKKIAADLGLSEPGYRVLFNCNAQAGQTVWHIHMHLLGGRNLGWPPG